MGLGYRFLYNFNIDKPGLRVSYVRQQGYLFLPIGMKGEIPIYEKISFFASLEYRILLLGHNTSKLSRLGFDNDLMFLQDKGYGWSVALGPKFFVGSGAIKAQLYYDYWNLEESDVAQAYSFGVLEGNFIEPKNHTHALGVMLSYDF